jgi:hypothetical protein
MYAYKVIPPSVDYMDQWNLEAPAWRFVARGVVTDDAFDPLTLKAIYVTGLMLESCRAVHVLLGPENLTPTVFYPAFAVFASTIELLGRCINGNASHRNTGNDLATGFKWLHRPNPLDFRCVPETQEVIATKNYPYTIADLVALRNFAAHGQAVNLSEIRTFDFLILGEFPPIVSRGVAGYLAALPSSEYLSTGLAKASVSPFRNDPIFQVVWEFMSDPHTFPSKVAAAINQMDWTYKSPLAQLLGGSGAP